MKHRMSGAPVIRLGLASILVVVTLVWYQIAPSDAAIVVNRPTLKVGDSWTYELCALRRMDSFEAFNAKLSNDDKFFEVEVLGKGNYLGFQRVYTMKRRFTMLTKAAEDPSYYVVDWDLNLLAFYNPATGAIFARFHGKIDHTWPIFHGKSWEYKGFAEGKDGLRFDFSGSVKVSALEFRGRQYLQQVGTEAVRLPDREEVHATLVIFDQTGQEVLEDEEPSRSGTGYVVSRNAVCLTGHPIHELVPKR